MRCTDAVDLSARTMVDNDVSEKSINIDFAKIQELVDRPAESLSVEIKNWIDPDQPDGRVEIIRNVLALRNYVGGT